MEIDKMLTVSTAHISIETNNWLIRECNPSSATDITAYMKDDVGFFVYVPDLSQFIVQNIPEDLVKCMKLAYENGCSWLCLDCDGSEVEGLEVFNWEEA